MGEQRTFAGIAWSQKGKVTRRERFLAEMDAVIPWAQLLALIGPYYPKAGQGRQPLGLEKMLRIYFLQQWFNLPIRRRRMRSTTARRCDDSPASSSGTMWCPTRRRSCASATCWSGTGCPRHASRLVNELLTAKGLLLRTGRSVDATIISAPSSTKNAPRESAIPEMKQTRKGNNWYFGMKLHVGTDPKGRVHSLTATHAAVADITELPALLHGAEHVLYGDQAYWKEADRQALEARGVRYRVNRRAAAPHRPLTARWRAINRARSRTRARGEHAFHVVKRLWGFAKVRYRGIAKNLARAFSLFALANLYLVRRQLLPPAARCVR